MSQAVMLCSRLMNTCNAPMRRETDVGECESTSNVSAMADCSLSRPERVMYMLPMSSCYKLLKFQILEGDRSTNLEAVPTVRGEVFQTLSKGAI